MLATKTLCVLAICAAFSTSSVFGNQAASAPVVQATGTRNLRGQAYGRLSGGAEVCDKTNGTIKTATTTSGWGMGTTGYCKTSTGTNGRWGKSDSTSIGYGKSDEDCDDATMKSTSGSWSARALPRATARLLPAQVAGALIPGTRAHPLQQALEPGLDVATQPCSHALNQHWYEHRHRNEGQW